MNATTDNEEGKTLLDLNSMMDQTLDDIEEAPDFANPPPGAYKLQVNEAKVETYTQKAKGDRPEQDVQRIKLIYSTVQTIQLASDKEPPVPDGTLFSETFQGTKEGLGYAKKRIREIMNVESTAGVSLGDMLSSIKGAQFDARLSIKKTAKNDGSGEFYENLQIRIVPPTSAA